MKNKSWHIRVRNLERKLFLCDINVYEIILNIKLQLSWCIVCVCMYMYIASLQCE